MNQDARKRKKGRRIFLPLPNYYLVLSSLTFDFLFSVSPLPTFIFSAPVHLFFQTANTAVHDSAYHSYFQSVPSQCLYGQNHRSEENIRYPFHNFTNHIYYGLCYKHESSQVQYRNVLSVKILAKISPSGSDAMIRSAAANQDAETDKDMIPRL